ARGNWHQPDHWEHTSFAAGMAQQPVLGVRPSDATAFCDWLTERGPGIWQYRLPKAGEVQPETIQKPTGWQTPIGFWVGGQEGVDMDQAAASTQWAVQPTNESFSFSIGSRSSPYSSDT